GFDPTNRFGPFSVDIIHYLPVCLNSLLYQMEQDIATLYTHLSKHTSKAKQQSYKRERQRWQDRATQRQRSIHQYLWDEDRGLYMDYHLTTRQRSHYKYATTFYPLWVGLASAAQAQRILDNLPSFEAPGGIRTSTHTSGNQWDDPFGWAPLQLIAIEGLQRYGYVESAKRLAHRFVSLVVEDFERTGSLVEKYDLDTRSSDVSQGIQYGYSSNEIGFGWTNGVLLALLKFLEDSDLPSES
ncbi:MAG: trehalase family glycosidase, partial [Cyanobacteria bacterium J06627_32]